MKIVQRHRGWVSDESLRDIAELLRDDRRRARRRRDLLQPDFRRPVGRHVILRLQQRQLLDAWATTGARAADGAPAVRRRARPRADGRFTLLPIVCLGACDHAPAMMIDDDLTRDLDPQTTGSGDAAREATATMERR